MALVKYKCTLLLLIMVSDICSFLQGFPSCRTVLMMMSFFAFVNVYCLRVNLSVALVAMVNTSYMRELDLVALETDGNNTKIVDEIVCEVDGNETLTIVDVRLDWYLVAIFIFVYIVIIIENYNQ